MIEAFLNTYGETFENEDGEEIECNPYKDVVDSMRQLSEKLKIAGDFRESMLETEEKEEN